MEDEHSNRKCVGAVLGMRIWIFQEQMVKNIFAASWCLSLNCTTLLLKNPVYSKSVCMNCTFLN